MADTILSACTNCKEFKPQSAFRPTHRQCVECLSAKAKARYAGSAEYRERLKDRHREWRASNRERKSAYDKQYAQTNRAHIREWKREYKLKNWDHIHAVQLQSRHRNLDRYRAREAAYREKNREACNARIKEWKAKNPDATVFYFHKRRAAQLRALPEWADLDAISAVYKRAQEIGVGHHVDHIVPLISKLVCGLHCEANLRVIPATENMKKNNRHWPDMWL
jgi:hypothetical protein